MQYIYHLLCTTICPVSSTDSPAREDVGWFWSSVELVERCGFHIQLPPAKSVKMPTGKTFNPVHIFLWLWGLSLISVVCRTRNSCFRFGGDSVFTIGGFHVFFHGVILGIAYQC